MSRTRRIPWSLYGLNLLLLACLAYLAAGGPAGFDADAARVYTRWTARVSFSFFVAAFTASALVRLAPNPVFGSLLRNRRYLGLNFALAHLVHLAALAAFFRLSGEQPEVVTLVFGGLAFVLVAILAATSNDRSVRALGRNWRRLHLVGVWYLWVIFTYTWLGQALNHGGLYWPILAIAIAAALLRFLPWLRGRRRSADASA